MFLIPINTDAPIYHRPWGTIGLIVGNCAVYALTLFAPGVADRMALPHGAGFTPIQWVTSNFLHTHFFHLLGNMIFLWAFGLVVEGKLGWRRFLLLYVVIGAAHCALEQAIFWNGSGVTYGASQVVYGLMTICLIWAPRNDLQTFYMFMLRVGVWDVPILLYALFQLAWSAALIVIWGNAASIQILHLMGAVVGGAAGLIMLRHGWVDCEGWDLFSVLSGNIKGYEDHMSPSFQEDMRKRRLKKKTAKTKAKRARRPVEDRPPPPSDEPSPEKFSSLIGKHKPHAALNEFRKIRHLKPGWKPTDQELLALARGLRQMRQFEDSIGIYEELLKSRPDFALGQLELAVLLVEIQQRPTAAQRCLDACDEKMLTPKQSQLFDQLSRRIQQLIEDGVVEIDRRG